MGGCETEDIVLVLNFGLGYSDYGFPPFKELYGFRQLSSHHPAGQEPASFGQHLGLQAQLPSSPARL